MHFLKNYNIEGMVLKSALLFLYANIQYDFFENSVLHSCITVSVLGITLGLWCMHCPDSWSTHTCIVTYMKLFHNINCNSFLLFSAGLLILAGYKKICWWEKKQCASLLAALKHIWTFGGRITAGKVL